jgi:hypothetical protein
MHEPCEMKYVVKYNKKHQVSTRQGIRYWNWWYNKYQCPICGAIRTRLANLDGRNSRWKKPMCKGEH